MAARPRLIDSGQDINGAEAVCQPGFNATFHLEPPVCFIHPHALRLRDPGEFVELERTIIPRLQFSGEAAIS